MARFAFRLQKVLEHRQREVEDAKRASGRALAALTDVERRIVTLVAAAAQSAEACGDGVNARLDLQAHLDAVDADARALEIERVACEQDLAQAQQMLLARKSELGAIEALEAKARQEWAYEEARRAQNSLDEWATMRRPAGTR